jgi:F420-0:gamma-glutamyl ligase
MNKYVGIIIADSRTTPLRLGTVGCALATYGFLSILDERGKKDLFGRPMHITVRAIADQLATAAEIVMGETDEMIPFAIIRGFPMIRISKDEEMDLNTLISPEECMFIGPYINKTNE